jgi:tetratricopeptide (TPR) repeat protein
MENARLQELFNFLREDPDDPFIIYAIAIEYSKADAGKAMEYFERLLKYHNHYLPAYYHAAKLYEAQRNNLKASELYKKGMEISLAQKDMKAYRELMNALNEMEQMNEE